MSGSSRILGACKDSSVPSPRLWLPRQRREGLAFGTGPAACLAAAPCTVVDTWPGFVAGFVIESEMNAARVSSETAVGIARARIP